MNKNISFFCILIPIFCFSSLGNSKDDFRNSYNTRTDESGWSERHDLNSDGVIDGADLAIKVSLDKAEGTVFSQRSYRSDRILVRCFPELQSLFVTTELKQLGVNSQRLRYLELSDYIQVPVPENLTVEQFLDEVQRYQSVKYAQFDYICRISKVPNDPYYNLQWNFHQIGSEKAWDLASGGRSSVIVAVLDTGIAYENYAEFGQAPDLAGTAFTQPYDFIGSDSHANDDEGHGTHVAGTIAQTTDNGIGVAGLAWKSTLMPVKVLDSQGNGTSSALAQGIRWAADKGAHVINMSLGFPIGSNGGNVVREAVSYAYSKGVIMVAAAGNDANDPGYTGGIAYPAAFEECIAVGAIRYDKRYTDYSNFGERITCVAPGGAIGLDQNRDGQPDGILQQTFTNKNPKKFNLVFYQGTSMATPHVAAAAALFVSRSGGGPDAFRRAIMETSQDLGPVGFDERYGYGLIDIPQIIRRGRGWGAN